jgi:hypothetical protein
LALIGSTAPVYMHLNLLALLKSPPTDAEAAGRIRLSRHSPNRTSCRYRFAGRCPQRSRRWLNLLASLAQKHKYWQHGSRRIQRSRHSRNRTSCLSGTDAEATGLTLPIFSLLVPFWLILVMAGRTAMLQVWSACLTAGPPKQKTACLFCVYKRNNTDAESGGARGTSYFSCKFCSLPLASQTNGLAASELRFPMRF